MAEIKIFGKWGTEGIKVMDPGLVDYVTLTPRMVPKTGARYAKQKFYKSRISIVERLINKLMIPGHLGKKHKLTSYKATGKSNKAYRIVEKTLSPARRNNHNRIRRSPIPKSNRVQPAKKNRRCTEAHNTGSIPEKIQKEKACRRIPRRRNNSCLAKKLCLTRNLKKA